MLKKQKSNLSLLNKTIFATSLVAVFATGLFGVNSSGNFLSNDKSNSILLKHKDNLNDEEYDKFILGRSFFTIPWVEAPSATTQGIVKKLLPKFTWEEFENSSIEEQERITGIAYEYFLKKAEAIDNKSMRGIFEKSKKSYLS